MSHPLLEKVLAEALLFVNEHDDGAGNTCLGSDCPVASELAEVSAKATAALPPDIADRLERALDVCGHAGPLGMCGGTRDSDIHDWPEKVPAHHPYQPLVQP